MEPPQQVDWHKIQQRMKMSLKWWIFVDEERPQKLDWDRMYTYNSDWVTCLLNMFPSKRLPWEPPRDLLLRTLVEDLSLTYYSQNVVVFYAGLDAIKQYEDLTYDIEL